MSGSQTSKSVGFCFLLGLVFAWTPEFVSAQDTVKLTNGHWYDGTSFVAGDFHVVEGVLRSEFEGDDVQVVDLAGAFILPGYGNAHTHGIGNGHFDRESRQFLERGVLYVANPNSVTSLTHPARGRADEPGTIDARFANGGLTSSGGHPTQIFESSAETSSMDGDAYFAIDDLDDLERRWPEVLQGKPDFLKIYLERSEHHVARKDDPDFYGKRGLDPALVSPTVELAHAAGLRVAAHVTSRHDFRLAVDAGADEIAHLPLEPLEVADATAAAASGTVVVTTLLSHRPSDDVDDLDSLHRNNLKLLRDAGVSIVLGTDSQATILDELHRLSSLGLFTRGELVHMLVADTPRWIYPSRGLGTLSDGAEASFVVLETNPLEDLEALSRVSAVFKDGQAIEPKTPPKEERRGIGQHLANLTMSRGVKAAIEEYHRLRAEEPDGWDFSEGQLEALGHAMMQHGKVVEATDFFQLNCEQFPESSNAWDSLGESYKKRGDTASAIEMYERAVELDPGNKNAIEKLEELRGR